MKTSTTVCYNIQGLPDSAYAELTLDQIIDNDANIISSFRQIRVYDNRFNFRLVLSKPFISAEDTFNEYLRIINMFKSHII